MRRIRRNVYFEREHAKRLDELALMKGVSVSGIVTAAVASFLSPEAADHREAAMAKRLDRLARQFERLERDQAIGLETLALFIRHQLSVTVPIPEAQVDAARAQGRARFEQFIEQLARHLQRGPRVLQALEEATPTAAEFFDAAGTTPAAEETAWAT